MNFLTILYLFKSYNLEIYNRIDSTISTFYDVYDNLTQIYRVLFNYKEENDKILNDNIFSEIRSILYKKNYDKIDIYGLLYRFITENISELIIHEIILENNENKILNIDIRNIENFDKDFNCLLICSKKILEDLDNNDVKKLKIDLKFYCNKIEETFKEVIDVNFEEIFTISHLLRFVYYFLYANKYDQKKNLFLLNFNDIEMYKYVSLFDYFTSKSGDFQFLQFCFFEYYIDIENVNLDVVEKFKIKICKDQEKFIYILENLKENLEELKLPYDDGIYNKSNIINNINELEKKIYNFLKYQKTFELINNFSLILRKKFDNIKKSMNEYKYPYETLSNIIELFNNENLGESFIQELNKLEEEHKIFLENKKNINFYKKVLHVISKKIFYINKLKNINADLERLNYNLIEKKIFEYMNDKNINIDQIIDILLEIIFFSIYELKKVFFKLVEILNVKSFEKVNYEIISLDKICLKSSLKLDINQLDQFSTFLCIRQNIDHIEKINKEDEFYFNQIFENCQKLSLLLEFSRKLTKSNDLLNKIDLYKDSMINLFYYYDLFKKKLFKD